MKPIGNANRQNSFHAQYYINWFTDIHFPNISMNKYH